MLVVTCGDKDCNRICKHIRSHCDDHDDFGVYFWMLVGGFFLFAFIESNRSWEGVAGLFSYSGVDVYYL